MKEIRDLNILAIESSCDETAAAVVHNGREVLSNIISSQIDLHKLYGGVVPEIASRKHIEKINQVIEEALKEADITLDDIDVVGVTYGPGLVGALLVGVAEAKAIAYARHLPLVGVHPVSYTHLDVYKRQDEYGGFSGIVTVEDLVEEIMGDINEEYEEVVPEIQKTGEDEYLLDGGVLIDDLNEELGLKLETENYDTLSGYLIEKLGHIPEKDDRDEIREGCLVFTVEEVRDNRITRAGLKILPPEDAGKEGDGHGRRSKRQEVDESEDTEQ